MSDTTKDAPQVIFELQNVRKVYKMGTERVVALEDISLKFEKGKIYCLLGTSGSGKSTLLNLLAGLEKPTKGSIKFKGKPLEKLSETQLTLYRQGYIGFVFQSYNLLPTLSALENVTLPLIFRKIPKRKRVQAARKMLKAVGLGNRWRHKPHELSGGQQQRVSLARAFVNDPQVIFADEPTGNLDTKTTYEMMDMITGMAREREQTLIIVTHDTEISEYADQIIQMRDGLIESIKDTERTRGNEKNEDSNNTSDDDTSSADNGGGI
ncbi:MAG: ABC transporter ATP-binding protein [Defluviitaleaceae bacterium]|nr:ABC transporter ATP-binding protein [Defluviitaleaceae bacterium]MCL2262340.1 ABC transporter ATP-binding protein [Defluviitaleaceae bacterium]